MATIDPAKKYVFTNAYKTTTKFLAASNNSAGATIGMIDSSSSPPSLAQWFVTPGNSLPYYRLHTVAGGGGVSVDVVNDNDTSSINLIMATSGQYTGQFWRFDNLPGGGYRLSNVFTGPNAHLDVWGDTLIAHLAGGDFTGQHWTLSALGSAPTGGDTATQMQQQSVTMVVQTQYVTQTATVGGGGAASTYAGGNQFAVPITTAVKVGGDTDGDDHDHGSSTSLSHGALAGIAAGGVALIALIVGLLLYIFCKKRTNKKMKAGSAADYGRVEGGGAGTAYAAAGDPLKGAYAPEAAPMMSPPPGYDYHNQTPHSTSASPAPHQQGHHQWTPAAGVQGQPMELPAPVQYHPPSELPG